MNRMGQKSRSRLTWFGGGGVCVHSEPCLNSKFEAGGVKSDPESRQHRRARW